MALFKIEKGLAANLATNRPNSVEGYCYFTSDDGKFYIDIATGTALTPAENGGSLLGVTRMPINSYLSDWAARSYADETGDILKSSYGAKLEVDGHTLKLIAKDNVVQLSSITLPDEKVKQTSVTASNYTNWRPIIWGASNSGTEGFTPTTVTDRVFTSNTLSVQPSSGTIKATTFKGKLTGNADTATKFASAQNIKLTGAITGEKSSQAGWEIATTLTDGIVATAKIANKAVTNAKLANSSITINGKSVSLGGSLSLADIGLGSALRFIGVTSTAIVDGTADNKVVINGSTVTATTGDVVINTNNDKEYVWLGSAWEILGDESSYEIKGVAQNLINSQPTDVVLGESTTFTNSTSSVSFGTHTTKSVIGSNATFTVTNPTISINQTKANVKATASGAAISLTTGSAITALGSPTSSSFVTSYPGVTGKLVTTTIKGVAGTTSVSAISSNTEVTATKISSYGTAAKLESTYTEASETLVISWTANTVASGSNVTATKTVYSNTSVATANSSATTVATGGVTTSGTGGTVLTGLGTAITKSALTGLGTPTTSIFATGVSSITQPTIKLTTVDSAESGVTVSVMTAASATASGGAVAFKSIMFLLLLLLALQPQPHKKLRLVLMIKFLL